MGDATDDDPGWPGLGKVLMMLVPGYWQFGMARARDQLIALRATFLGFSLSLVVFGVVLQFIGSASPTHVMPWLAILAAAAVFTSVAVRVIVKPLDCSSESALASSYRARFFLGMAFTHAVALFGFCFAFIGAPTWVYDVGGAFAILRMWTLDPPTPRRLQQHQAALASSGCALSLVGAIRRTGPPRA